MTPLSPPRNPGPKPGRGQVNPPLRVIILAGGIGTGKSRAADLLAQWGAYVIGADDLSRAAVEPGTDAFAQVVSRFGGGIVNPDGSLNRRQLGELIFADQQARKDLEAIIHPWVRREMARQIDNLRVQPSPPPAVVLEVPLLSARKTPVPVDEIWVVTAALETRIRRVMQRDGLSRGEIVARMAAQPSPDELSALAQVIIDNDGSWQQTVVQLRDAWESRIVNAGSTG